MKTQILILAIIFTVLSCKAQTPIINQSTYSSDQGQEGMYLKDIDNNLDRFVGTWIWQNGNSSFEITLTKEEMVENTIYYSDYIVGKYKYIENGLLKANNLASIYTGMRYPIIGSFEQTNHNHLNIGFTDYIKHKSGTGYFELIAGTSPQQAKWKAWGHARILVDGEPSNQGFSLPSYQEIILIKQ